MNYVINRKTKCFIKIFSLILILSMFLSLLTGCEDNTSQQGEENEDTLNYLIVDSGQVVLPLTPYNTLNPLLTNNKHYYYFSKLMYEGLFEFDEHLEAFPKLASDYSIENEGKTVYIRLKEDVYWHDGEKFTSQDVDFTLNAIKNISGDVIFGSRDMLNVLKQVKSKVIDNSTIELTFNDSYGNALEMLTFPIIPQHQFSSGRGKSGYLKAIELEGYTPIGTGPYKFAEYDRYKSITLEASELYRDGVPKIEKIFGAVLANEEMFLTAFEAGQISICPAVDVDWDKYNQNERIDIYEFITANYEFLGFNMTNPLFSTEKGSEIRKAIAYGINRQDIIQKLYLGHATSVDVPLHPDSYLLSEDSVIYGYNEDLAKEILKKAGFADLDGDGVLEDEEGNRLSFRLTTNSSSLFRETSAYMIKEDLAGIGIETVLDFTDGNQKKNTGDNQLGEINTRLEKRDFDIVLLGWQTSVIPDLGYFFHSTAGPGNFIGYSSPVMDSILTNAKISSHKDDKMLTYGDMQKNIIKDLPYVSLYYKNGAMLCESKIIGELRPTFFNPYNGLEKCFIAIMSE